MASLDIGIDLGTATVIVYDSKKGIVLKEPSVIAVNTKTNKVVSIGEEAFQMLGRTPDRYRAVQPLQDGVISDYKLTEEMIKYFLNKICPHSFFRPRVAICVPSGITDVEAQAVVDSAIAAGARKVYLIEEPVAAAIGAGMDITKAQGNAILDIGGGTSDIAVLSLSGIVCKDSVKVAGSRLDEALIRHIRQRYKILIGGRTAETLKKEIGTVWFDGEERHFVVKGRDLITGLPRPVRIARSETQDVLLEEVSHILAALQRVLERTPPELVGDIQRNGLVMTGGGALLDGLGMLISHRLKIPARIAEDPMECVAIGTGQTFQYIGKLYDGFLSPSTHSMR